MLLKLRQSGFLIQPDKCEFAKTCLVYLGHLVTKDGLKPMPEKIEKLRHFPVPINVKQVQAFLGFCNYYRKFIPNHADLTNPLNQLL